MLFELVSETSKSAVFSLAGVEGIEPSSGVLETLILPMNYTPILILSYFTMKFIICQSFFIFC